MKKLCAVGLAVIGIISIHGQGTVHFGNTATTLITTNDFQGHIGNILGAGNYRFGLYIGPFGTSSDLWTLMSVATNGIIPGRFDGGMLFSGFPPATSLSFQVRGWSIFAGPTFESAYAYALANAVPTAYLGESAEGFFTAPSSGSIELFGTGPGQVGGFALTPVVPEPSAYVLGLLGLSLFACARQKHRKVKTNE